MSDTSAAAEFAKEAGGTYTMAQLPEAPASATLRVQYKGFEVSFTLRGWDQADVLAQLDTLVAQFSSDIAKPVHSAGAVVEDPASGEMSFDCPQMRVERLDTGKLRLELFKVLGDGSTSRFGEVKHVASRADMWAILEPLMDSKDLEELPVKLPVEWVVTYRLGRETGRVNEETGLPNRYRDLVSIQKRGE